jgi:Flp pilus assembly protein TadG
MRTERDGTSSTRRCTALPRARRCRGETGAILAEAAFVTPMFVILLFGILEFGAAFRDYLTLNDATSSGAREASISANSGDADYQVIQAIKKSMSAVPTENILRIVIFHPAGPSSAPTTSCAAGTPSAGTGTTYADACNTYTNTALSWTSSSGNYGCGASAADRYWCPTVRKTAQTGINGPPDYVGVYIVMNHPYITGLFGNNIVLTKTSIIKIEPQSLQ